MSARPRPHRAISARVAAVLFAALASLAGAATAEACGVCGSGDPTLTVMGAERAFDGRFRIAGDLRLGSSRVGAGAGEIEVREQRLEVSAAYAPTATTFLSVAFPVLRRAAEGGGAHGAHKTVFTPGDVEIRAKQFVWSARKGPFVHQAAIQGGLKLPTAPVQTDAAGTPLPSVLQPGMGAITPFAGLFYGLVRGPWSLYSSATVYLPYAVREGPHASGSFRTSLSGQRQIGRAFAARLGLDTRLDSNASAGEKVDPNSGGFIGYVSPELVLSPVNDLLFVVGAHFPAVQALRGHHREGALLSFGVTYDI